MWEYEMSSFSQHCDNIKDLENMGFDMSDYTNDGEATCSSWSYDEQVDIMNMVIEKLKTENFRCN